MYCGRIGETFVSLAYCIRRSCYTYHEILGLFYSTLTVLVLGFLTMLLQFLQVYLTAWQVRLNYESNWLATEQNRLQLQALQAESGA